jgi:sec-independent protein translocase protein TatB
MEILGIGPTELVFIFIIALILLGPKDMQKAGRTVGVWLNKIVSSEWWRAARETSRELSHLPNRLMREANLAEAELRQTMAETDPASRKPDLRPDSATENSIAPPVSQPFNSAPPAGPSKAAGAGKSAARKSPSRSKKTTDA